MKDNTVLLLRYLVQRDMDAYELPEEIGQKGGSMRKHRRLDCGLQGQGQGNPCAAPKSAVCVKHQQQIRGGSTS